MIEQEITYCVIGSPIEHSLSPRIHNFIREQLGLSFIYDAIEVTPDQLEGFVKHSRSSLQPGFNVTLPLKEVIVPFLDEIDPAAAAVGAVNTVFNLRGILRGYNTDIQGCREALERAGIKQIEAAVIIGAGGAARAGIMALSEMGCRSVILLCRDPEKADKIIEDFQNMNLQLTSRKLNRQKLDPLLQSVPLIINATPLGMWPNTGASPIPVLDINPQTVVMDMVPNPPITRFLKTADAAGCKTVSGLDMLIGQALAAQTIWQERSMPKSLFHEVKQYLISRQD